MSKSHRKCNRDEKKKRQNKTHIFISVTKSKPLAKNMNSYPIYCDKNTTVHEAKIQTTAEKNIYVESFGTVKC